MKLEQMSMKDLLAFTDSQYPQAWKRFLCLRRSTVLDLSIYCARNSA